MTRERKEGFWWVRCVGDAPARAWAPKGWFVAHVRGFAMVVPGRDQEIECHSERWEWGPYLGKEPGETVHLAELSVEMRGRVRDEQAWSADVARLAGVQLSTPEPNESGIPKAGNGTCKVCGWREATEADTATVPQGEHGGLCWARWGSGCPPEALEERERERAYWRHPAITCCNDCPMHQLSEQAGGMVCIAPGGPPLSDDAPDYERGYMLPKACPLRSGLVLLAKDKP